MSRIWKNVIALALLLCVLKDAMPMWLLLQPDRVLHSDTTLVVEADNFDLFDLLLDGLAGKKEEKEGKEEKEKNERLKERLFEENFRPHPLYFLTASHQELFCATAQFFVRLHCAQERYAVIHARQSRLIYLTQHSLKLDC